MKRLFWLMGLLLSAIPTFALAQLPAFPGAQGGGAGSVGGRGGQIMDVTNLNDSGSGSLRACVEAFGPRICIFRLGGIIVNLSRLQVSHPFLTIAGQTAPGGGITIGGAKMVGEALFIDTNDVVVQNLTCNGYNPNTPTGPDTGTVCFELTSGAHNVIFDGITARWAGNKLWIVYSNDTKGPCCDKVVRNVTVQHSLFYEPNAAHPVGPGTDAAAWPNEAVNIDFHHTAFVNIGHRIPMVATSNFRMVSTITYNWDYFAAAGGGSAWDFINNKWVAGNMNAGGNQGDPHPVQFWTGQGGNCTGGPTCDLPGTPSAYMSGNVGPQGTDYDLTAEEPGNDAEGRPESAHPIRAEWRRSVPLPAETFPITADATDKLDAMAPSWGNSWGLDCAGNRVSHQDSQDKRIVAQYQAKGPGGTFTGQFQQPAIAPGTPCPADPVNHLPVAYEARVGIAAGTPANTKAANGETIVNNYLAGVGSTVTPPPPPPTTSPSGTTVAPGAAGSITDASGKVWTFGASVPVSSNPDCAPNSCGSAVVQNGTVQPGTAAVLLLYFNGTLYQKNGAGVWFAWSGTAWTRQATGDPRPGSPPPSIAVSVACPAVIFPAKSTCVATVTGTTSTGVTWSANAPGGVYSSVAGVTSATVTTTSVADPTKSASATIAITQPTPPAGPLSFSLVLPLPGGGTQTVVCTYDGGTNAYSCH